MQVPSVFQQIKPIPGYGQPSQRDKSLGNVRVAGFGGPADPMFAFLFGFWYMVHLLLKKTTLAFM
jgi:hypothetical protein